MILQELLEINELCDRPGKIGNSIVETFQQFKEIIIEKKEISEPTGSTEFIRIHNLGKEGHLKNGVSPTLELIGRVGEIELIDDYVICTSFEHEFALNALLEHMTDEGNVT